MMKSKLCIFAALCYTSRYLYLSVCFDDMILIVNNYTSLPPFFQLRALFLSSNFCATESAILNLYKLSNYAHISVRFLFSKSARCRIEDLLIHIFIVYQLKVSSRVFPRNCHTLYASVPLYVKLLKRCLVCCSYCFICTIAYM